MRRLWIVLFALALIAPLRADAGGASSCGGAWSSQASCSFQVSSGDRVIKIFGRATGGAPSRVRVEIALPTASPGCEASSTSGPAECSLEIDVSSLCVEPRVCPLPHVHSPLALTCVVRGAAVGDYVCGTGG